MSRVIILFFLVIICSLTHNLSAGFEINSEYRSFICSHTTLANTTYRNNVNNLLSNFNSQSSRSSFHNTTSGEDPDIVYGYYLCRGDVSSQNCEDCINNGTTFAIERANCSYEHGFYFGEYCMFQYSNRSMFGVLEDEFVLSSSSVGENATNYEEYNQTVITTMLGLINEANSSDNFSFATREVNVSNEERVYNLVQCTPDIAGVNCSRCLRRAFSAIQDVTWSQGGLAYLPKCQMRFDNRSFYSLGNMSSTIPNNGWQIRYHGLVYYVLVLFMVYFILVEA